jgi:PAS domain S-box-containing protein
VIEPPVPLDEERRVAVLHALDILDTPNEDRFDRVTRIAAAAFDVPIVLISLVDTNRQWFKSCVGLDDAQTDRSVSFCAHALERPDALVIPDATDDMRFADNPYVVGEPYIRFYAGHPLRVGIGSAIGTLCLIDVQPRTFTAADRALLADLATLVEQELTGHQQVQMLELLADSEAHLAGILASVAEGVATFRADGTVLSFNRAGEDMFGLPLAAVIGKPITNLVSVPDVPIILELLATRAAQPIGEQVRVEVRGRRGDGSEFQMEVSASELAGSNGEIFIAVARDVTEVSRLRHRQRAILDAAGDGIVGIGLDGRVTFANPTALDLLWRDEDSLIGSLLHAETHHTKPDGTPYPWDECPTYLTITEGRPHRVEDEVYIRSDGSPFPTTYASAPLFDDSGQVDGAVIVFSDITARRQVETLKDQFISVVSHELRTPLTSIQGALGLVSNGILGELPAEADEMVGVALKNAQRLARLVNDILDLERISSGRLELSMRPCDAAIIAEDAVKAVQGAADLAGVPLELDVPTIRMSADADRLVQALTNLIGNAVKFSPAGSPVLITASTNGKTVTFDVADRGRGIPSDKIDLVFERFQQVDVSDRREKGGSGLGLPITRNIARQHGGEVSATSVVGEGSTFTLEVPVG